MKYPIRFDDRAWILCDQIVPKDQRRIVLKIAGVIALGNEIKISGPNFLVSIRREEILY